MQENVREKRAAHRLVQLGVVLFLLGLLTGFALPVMANPRMGLSSHLEGVMNGIFLVILGLIWGKLKLGRIGLATAFWLATYGTFVNWATTLLAAFWGAGTSMPIAAADRQGTILQETIINVGLWSLAVCMVGVCVLVLWGLRRPDETASVSEVPARES
jgi:hydroxylaminobenzene mutase